MGKRKIFTSIQRTPPPPPPPQNTLSKEKDAKNDEHFKSKVRMEWEYEDETGESHPDAHGAESCDSLRRIGVRVLVPWLHFSHAQIHRQSVTYVSRSFSRNQGLIGLCFFCSLCFKRAWRPQCRDIINFAKRNSASAAMLTSRLWVEQWGWRASWKA